MCGLLISAIGTGAVISAIDIFRNRERLPGDLKAQFEADGASDIFAKSLSAIKVCGHIVYEQKLRDFRSLTTYATDCWTNRQRVYQDVKHIFTGIYTLNRNMFTLAVENGWKDPLNLLFLPGAFIFETIGFFSGLAMPDIDIALLGIGHHRNWFTHSAIPPYILHSIFKKGIDSLDEAAGKSVIAQGTTKIVRSFGGALLAGYCYGTGVHLFLDTITPKDVIGFPVGALLSGGRLVDSMYLFANGMGCFHLGNKTMELALPGRANKTLAEHKLVVV